MEQRKEIDPEPRECCMEHFIMVNDTFDGKIVQRADLAIDDFRTRNDGLKVAYFSLENQIESGVDLKSVSLNLSTLPLADRLSYEAERLSEYVKANSKPQT